MLDKFSPGLTTTTAAATRKTTTTTIFLWGGLFAATNSCDALRLSRGIKPCSLLLENQLQLQTFDENVIVAPNSCGSCEDGNAYYKRLEAITTAQL